jgi:hypothetical protein
MLLQPYKVDDFSAGLTDYPVGTDPRGGVKIKNLQVTVDRNLLTRWGSLLEGNTDTICKIPGPVTTLLPGLASTDRPFKCSNYNNAGRLFAYNGTTHVELVGPTSNPLFTSAHFSGSDNRFAFASWANHHFLTSTSYTQKPQKIYRDNGGALQLRTAGLPVPAATTFTHSGAGGANSYNYAIGWKHTYQVGNRTFVDRGPLLRTATNATYTGAFPNTVGGFPALSNGGSDNYNTAGGGTPTSGLVLELYRTTNNGKIYYLVGTVANGTTSLADALTDAQLQTQVSHYSTGGTPDYDPPPKCKFVHITERGVGLYGYVQDGTDDVPTMFKQSIPGAPDKVPGSFNGELEDELIGVSSYRGVPIFFSTKYVYRGEGLFTASGQGGMIPRRIAESVGCISHTSIVQTPDGVFFAGVAGFYWTDGFTVVKVSDRFNTTYQTYVPSTTKNIYGAYEPVERLVFWNFAETGNSDGLFVLHLRYGVKPESTFTVWGGLSDSNHSYPNVYPAALPATVNQNFHAKCLLMWNGNLYRGDDRGYAFYHTSTSKTDPRVVTSVDCGTWGTSAIVHDFRTIAHDFGISLVRKMNNRLIVTQKTHGSISTAVWVDRDLAGSPRLCKEIKYPSGATWGMPGVLWGDPILYSPDPALRKDFRMIPVPGLRCDYRQLYVQNAFTIITKSDNLGTATLNAATKVLTLDDLTQALPADLLDYYVSFPDGAGAYTNSFLITAATATSLTFSDATNLAPASGSTKWVIRGFAKGEVMELHSLDIPFAPLGTTEAPYRPGTEGSNA